MRKIVLVFCVVSGFSSEASAQFIRPPFRPYVNTHALDFGGPQTPNNSSEYVMGPHISIAGSTKLGISFWMRLGEGSAVAGNIMGQGEGVFPTSQTKTEFFILAARQSSNDTFAIRFGMTNASGGAAAITWTTPFGSIVRSRWSHVFIDWSGARSDATAAAISIDGVSQTITLASSGNPGAIQNLSTDNLRIATRNVVQLTGLQPAVNWSQFFLGQLDEISIWKDAVPTAAQTYNGGHPFDPLGMTPRPIFCANFNGDTISKTVDQCGMNHGTPINMEATDIVGGNNVQL